VNRAGACAELDLLLLGLLELLLLGGPGCVVAGLHLLVLAGAAAQEAGDCLLMGQQMQAPGSEIPRLRFVCVVGGLICLHLCW